MKHPITVVPLGPGDPSLLTVQSADLLRSGKPLYLRTDRHPVASWLKRQQVAFSSLDGLYDSAPDFDAMNEDIVHFLLSKAAAEELVYAVPDPVSDRTVSLLARRASACAVPVRVLSGVGLVGSCLAACLPYSDPDWIQSVSAFSFSSFPWNPAVSLLATELDSRLLAGEIKLKLGRYMEDQAEVYFFPPSEEAVRKPVRIQLCDLDRQKKYDQTASVFIPGADWMHRKRFCFEDLLGIMNRLRAQDGCPWDREQDHDSLKPYMVEEAWEAVDAIDRGDTDHLADELGDVLLQVVFHAAVAESFDEFEITDVVSAICRKMIIRHPNLFPDAAVRPAGSVSSDPVADWEIIKQLETGSKTVGESLNDVSSSLPSLKYAIKISRKLSRLPSLQREPEETAGEIARLASAVLKENCVLNQEILGEMLIRCMDLCRSLDIDGEVLLHEAVDRLKTGFQRAEQAILSEGKQPEELTRAELEEYMNLPDGPLPGKRNERDDSSCGSINF